jgi:hypothetical protein
LSADDEEHSEIEFYYRNSDKSSIPERPELAEATFAKKGVLS